MSRSGDTNTECYKVGNERHCDSVSRNQMHRHPAGDLFRVKENLPKQLGRFRTGADNLLFCVIGPVEVGCNVGRQSARYAVMRVRMALQATSYNSSTFINAPAFSSSNAEDLLAYRSLSMGVACDCRS